eukprot:CAMPEP_0197440774 /NCGR_PEP_ID=MMETSP1175-20131217/7191_1 /TAXON_ID=1003142 /ORGANISM="Triceratium dubium, Strain CCMP147" /LENGTH=1386 /DNA_ID=CAMNT_0042970943 /DNA_START=120 /DNA_END=4280 /DNA_ORIENTATION=+
MTLPAGIFLVVSLLPAVPSSYGQGIPGYVDDSFSCPLVTSCPAICVSDAADCPDAATCPQDRPLLCADGSCVAFDVGCDPDLYSPCEENVCGNAVTCAIPVMEWDACSVVFEQAYAEAENCDAADELPALVSWTAPAFVVGYCWICIVTALIFGYCAYNQRLAPIGEVLPLDEFIKAGSRRKSSYPVLEDMTKSIQEGNDETLRIWTQTAYKKTFAGTSIYVLTVATFWAFHCVLAVLVKFYYDQQWERETNNPFEDEVQVLSVFVVVLIIGFVWSMHLKWPSSIRSLFLRRCTFEEADFVAVWSPASEQINENTKRARHIQRILCCMDAVGRCFTAYFSFLFSDVTRPKIKGSFKFCPVEINPDGSKSFTFRLRRYNMGPKMACFHPGIMDVGKTLHDFLDQSDGLSEDEVIQRVASVGSNKIDIKKPHPVRSILEEFNKLFYVYQMYIIWTWLNYWYYYMGLIYLATLIAGGFSVAYIKYKNDRDLYKLSQLTGDVKVLRDNNLMEKKQDELVPGDVITLTPGVASTDMILISGENVLVDEAALTGEAHPVVKSAIDPAEDKSTLYDIKTHRANTVFAGTSIVECKEGDRAIVIKAGSFSTRGELIRDILFYERHRFKFDVEIEIVLGILIIWALIAFGITVRLLGGVVENSVYTFFYGAYVVASVIPPLLPTVFVVSVGISHERLFKQRIACSESQAILVAGKVSVAFFDKTGTLTKQGLDFISAQSFVDGKFYPNSFSKGLTRAMGVCHTLFKSDKEGMIGNQVDVTMFQASNAVMDCSNTKSIKITPQDGSPLAVTKRFEFDHNRMTQSVVVTDIETGRMYAFVKGSAEAMKRLCTKESLPTDFDERAKSSAAAGIYQITLAMREVTQANPDDCASIPRDEIESNLNFLGFLNFKNQLREETNSVLQELASGDVRSIMVTGDSIFTGVCIAKESGMVSPNSQVLIGLLDEFGKIVWTDSATDDVVSLPSIEQLQGPDCNINLAVSGEVWTMLLARSETDAMQLANHIKVFGRCSPNDKVSIVATFVKNGYITMMCGDGGNDCGALKTAHVGIALSDSEASIVSPFTSLDKSVTSVLAVLKEGRCALASALKVYKYELMYGQVTTFNQMANAYFGITFAEWNWVFMDAIWMISMAFTLPRAQANKKLSPARPTASLLGAHTMSSYLGILLINFLAMVVGLVALNQQSWYSCRKWVLDDISNAFVLGDNYESTVIWLITGYQYLSSAAAYNFGFTHRAPWWSNCRLVFFFVAFTVLHYYVTLSEDKVSCLFRINCGNENVVRPVIGSEPYPINNNWNTTVMPYSFRWVMIGIMTANLFLNMAWEYYVVNGLQKKLTAKGRAKKDTRQGEHAPRRASVKVSTIQESTFETKSIRKFEDEELICV